MLRFLKKFIWLCIISGLLYSVYLGYEIHLARALTVEKVIPMLSGPELKLSKGDLSARQLEILLAIEDPAFFTHHGIDLTSPGAGMTTITQGLVKRLYFKRFKPGIAKIRQTLFAVFVLNDMVSKDDQLKLFLNSAYFGLDENKIPISGFAEASRIFFKTELQKLDEEQFISLVATLIAPGVFSPIKNRKMNSDRVEKIKQVLSGRYIPKGLFDLYYGKVPEEFQKDLPPGSYFESYYD